MQGGDIDNTPVSRVYIVWEGTIAKRPEKASLIDRVVGRRNPYVVDEAVRRHLWDNWQRLSVRFDAVVFASDPEQIQAIIDRENLPISTTWNFESREEFIQQLPFMPWVSHVIDHDAPMAYGGRGATLDSVRR